MIAWHVVYLSVACVRKIDKQNKKKHLETYIISSVSFYLRETPNLLEFKIFVLLNFKNSLSPKIRVEENAHHFASLKSLILSKRVILSQE